MEKPAAPPVPSSKHQSGKQQAVSLRGASVREISRDALLEQVARERELRNYARRAAAAALYIQCVWRRYEKTKKVAKQLEEEWDSIVSEGYVNNRKTSKCISQDLLRPLLFFATLPQKKSQPSNLKRMSVCFRILLDSINSTEPDKNFCFLALGTIDEKSTWLYQMQKLVVLSSFILAESGLTLQEGEDTVFLASLALRLVVSLTDLKTWKGLKNENLSDADAVVKSLIKFMGSERSGLYSSTRKYIMKHCAWSAATGKAKIIKDNKFLIAASAITLCLRPLHVKESGTGEAGIVYLQHAYEQYILYILTIPCITQRLPSILQPALKHASVLIPCLRHIMIFKEKVFGQMMQLSELTTCSSSSESVSCYGWAVTNIINLATEYDNASTGAGHFVQDLDFMLYVSVINCISENLISWLEDRLAWKQNNYAVPEPGYSLSQDFELDDAKRAYLDLLKPIHQQWHLRRLLSLTKKDSQPYNGNPTCWTSEFIKHRGSFEFQDIVLLYYNMVRICSIMNPLGGALPILNVLSFMPGFLVDLWGNLEYFIFSGVNKKDNNNNANQDAKIDASDEVIDGRKHRQTKDGGKWANVLQKITGKSVDLSTSLNETLHTPSYDNMKVDDLWDIEPMRRGPQGISKDLSCVLYLFCAVYAHLLLVLDDIEFYEKQIPFTLLQQRQIASVLNTFVYNSFTYNSGQSNRHVIHAAVKCLHLLYERDCRHKFCPSFLWLAPGRKARVPIAVAARAHETAYTSLHASDTPNFPSTTSVLTTIPHVYPFEERVQLFREFIKLDKASRQAAVEVSGAGAGLIEIVVRRTHIVEDGFKQLNGIGPKLKSKISVSFVSECGLPEVGLDYGGLSKEFLTDLSRSAFSPQFGLFCQTSTQERHLVPNLSARSMDNGMQMIEFLGRVVGKALYEGILLDYSFSLVFVQKLLGRYSFLDELSVLDPELYRNLMHLKHYDGDVMDLSLDFTITEEVSGKLVVTELKPGGRDICVTNENKLHYVHAIANYKLNRQMLPFANAFYRGLTDLISPSWLSIFNANEFNQLISGGHHDIDVDDLRANTRYTGGYSEGSRTVKLFWEVVKGLKPNERCMLLKFVTSCSRAPLLGFKYLHPSFTIHKVPCDMPLWATIGGHDVDRLPSASTCYNTLKLPTYKRSSNLRNKLLYAISSNSGFELS